MIPLGLTAAALAANAEIHKIILSKEVEDIMKIVKSLKDSGLLIKYIIQTIEKEMKEQGVRFLWDLFWYIIRYH